VIIRNRLKADHNGVALYTPVEDVFLAWILTLNRGTRVLVSQRLDWC